MALRSDAIDFKLDPVTWDLVIENGDFVFVSGSEAVAQRCKYKLQLFKGEWFLDKDAGTPWIQELLGQKLDITLARSIFYNLLIKVDGVASIEQLEVEINSSTRAGKIVYTLTTVFGDTIDETVELGAL